MANRPTDRSRPAARLRTRVVTMLAGGTLLLAACGTDGSGTADPAGTSAVTLSIFSANFDLAVGEDRRLLLAVFTDRRERVAGGTVEVRLAYLGEESGGVAELGAARTADFLPIPGLDVPEPEAGPAIVSSDALTGVYRVRVDLDRAGFWGVSVTADLADVGRVEGRTTFRVLEAPEVIDVGDPAPPTPNVVRADVDAGRAEPQSLDSRLRTVDEPDRAASLHTVRIDDALAAGRPVVIGITTPVYCVSLVCGPLTEYLVDVARRFGDRADFVHIEVYQLESDKRTLSPAAAAWIETAPGMGGNEPWVFLVGGDGTVLARWDNVVDPEELEAALSALPVLGGA